MQVSARRLVWGVLLVVGLTVFALVLRVGYQWSQALANVDAMIATPVALPVATAPVVPVVSSSNPQATSVVQPTSVPLPTPEPPLPDSPLNILILGTDARPKDTEPPRTDAIVLMHLDRRTNQISMLSFPRDLWVTFPDGYGEGRINAAYGRGEKQIGPGGGAALAKATVSNLTGLHIDNYMLMNFTGFKTLIDELGGITIDVPKAIDDPKFPTDNYKTIVVHFDAGPQVMDGDRALIYARTRHADNDFGRNQRQQEVLMAIFDAIRQRGLLDQITSVDAYTGALRDAVKTDMPRDVMFELARWGRNLTGGAINRYAIDSHIIVDLQEPATFAVKDKELRRLIGQMTGDAVSSAGGTERK